MGRSSGPCLPYLLEYHYWHILFKRPYLKSYAAYFLLYRCFWFLNYSASPVFQEGNIIDLVKIPASGRRSCSGLRYLFPLMSFGYLVAFLLDDRWWKRIVIFLSTIPITIGLNSLRIALIGVTVDLWGQKMAEGFIHSFEGWSIFLICVAILMGEVWILTRIGARGHFRYQYLVFPRISHFF